MEAPGMPGECEQPGTLRSVTLVEGFLGNRPGRYLSSMITDPI